MGLGGKRLQAPSAPVSRHTQLPAVCVATHTRRSDRHGRLSWAGEGTILADPPRLTGLDGKRSCHLAEGWLLKEQGQQGLQLEEGQPGAQKYREILLDLSGVVPGWLSKAWPSGFCPRKI